MFYVGDKLLNCFDFVFLCICLTDGRKGGRESRSERRTDSSDRKRGRGSRNASPEREKESKRRRDDPPAEEPRVSEGPSLHERYSLFMKESYHLTVAFLSSLFFSFVGFEP